MKRLQLFILLLLFPLLVARAAEPELFMLRSTQPFPETMSSLQNAIHDQGYTVSRVQFVDKGLIASGFKTDVYRVVFFGKADEIHRLATRYPDLVPYLPLQIAIFAENDETILIAANPENLAAFYPHAGLDAVFKHWHDDLAKIFQAVQNAD